MKILAIDPGLDRIGYAVIEKKGSFKIIDYGRITTSKKDSLGNRVKQIGKEFNKLSARHKPDKVVIEEIFFSKNKKTIIVVAQAQGVLLSLCAEQNLIAEFINPMQVKLALTGDGHADKKQIQKMLKLEYNLEFTTAQDDISDAVAIGLSYFHLNKRI